MEAASRHRGPWSRGFRVTLFGASLGAILVVVLIFQFLAGRYQLNVGDVSPYDIRAPRKVPNSVSQVLTKEERDRAEAAVADKYVFDPNIGTQQKVLATNALNRISDIRRQSTAQVQRQQDILNTSGLKLTPDLANEIVLMDETGWQNVRTQTLQVLDQVTRSVIREDQIEEARRTAANLIDPGLPESQRAVVAALVGSFLKANYLVDVPATTEAKRRAREDVAPVYLSLSKGETILREGDVVKPIDLEKLEAAGLRNPSVHWPDLASTGLIVFASTGLLCLYIYLFRPQVLSSDRSLLLLALIIVVTVLTAKVVIPGREDFAYLFPVATAPMLFALMLDSELAFVATVQISLAMGLVANGSFELVAASLLAGFVGVVGIWRTERFSRFFLTGLGIAAVVFAVVASFELASGDPDIGRLVRMLPIAIGNGGLTGALTLGTVWLLGHIFGITTTLGLLELGNQTQPLFRRLFLEAPGTYQHSMLVADLATRASQEIGADALLARVGAYYHDIGKIPHPYDFIENQLEGQNIHDHLEPAASIQRLTAHIRNGLNLARQYGLPGKVEDIISQHHGTTVAQFFYRKAQERAGDAPVDRDLFRYPGPRPQTKEAAIVMLADSVEAAVRASSDHSPERIEKIVDKIISDRLSDGQLSECDLTMRDIEILRRTFVRVLQAIFHPRIPYPEAAETEAEGVLSTTSFEGTV